MTKNILLATAAMGVVALAGQATAHDLSFRNTSTAAGHINSTNTNSATPRADDSQYTDVTSLTGLYLVAREALGSTLGSGTLSLANPLTSGTLPSGNNFYTITLSNATFGSAFTTANLIGANCSAVISSGGTSASSSVTFLVSSTGSAGCAGFQTVDVPVLPSAAGTVSVTTSYTTEIGTPIDGPSRTINAIYAIDAFQPAFNATIGTTANANGRVPGAGANTTALIGPASSGGATYTTLGGDNNLGRLAIYVDTRANRNLTPGTPVSVNDITAATVSITGDFTAFDGSGGAALPTLTNSSGTAVTSSSVTATLATFSSTTVDDVIKQTLDTKPNGSQLQVTPDGGQIPTSNYSANIAFTLNPTFFAAQANDSLAFETIEREGTNLIAPWVAGSQAGAQTVIRMSSTGAASGGVTLQLINAVQTGLVPIADSGSCPVGVVPSAGDLSINVTTLTSCFGPFLRGDVLITVEAAPASLTGKMRNTSNGNVYESTLGRYSGSLFNDAAATPINPTTGITVQ